MLRKRHRRMGQGGGPAWGERPQRFVAEWLAVGACLARARTKFLMKPYLPIWAAFLERLVHKCAVHAPTRSPLRLVRYYDLLC